MHLHRLRKGDNPCFRSGGSLLLCISKHRASRGGHVASPTTDTPRVAWRTGNEIRCLQGSGWVGTPLEHGQLYVGGRWEQCQDGTSAQPICQEQLSHGPTDSFSREEARSPPHTVCTGRAFYRRAEETSAPGAGKI